MQNRAQAGSLVHRLLEAGSSGQAPVVDSLALPQLVAAFLARSLQVAGSLEAERLEPTPAEASSAQAQVEVSLVHSLLADCSGPSQLEVACSAPLPAEAVCLELLRVASSALPREAAYSALLLGVACSAPAQGVVCSELLQRVAACSELHLPLAASSGLQQAVAFSARLQGVDFLVHQLAGASLALAQVAASSVPVPAEASLEPKLARTWACRPRACRASFRAQQMRTASEG